MNRTNRHAFTLVELLTVIAVISLLVAIVIPAIAAARAAARDTATAKLISTLDSSSEIFHGDLGRYPISGGPRAGGNVAPGGGNPFESGATGQPVLTGAQWLAMQLVGPTQTGYVNPTRENDTNDDDVINDVDWRAWYEINSPVSEKVRRLGPYVQPDAKTVLTVEQLEEKTGTDAPPMMKTGNSIFRNSRLPMFVDAHGGPILYYAATPDVKPPNPFSRGNPSSAKFTVGTYDMSHNALLTGSDNSNGDLGGVLQQKEGWDFASVSQAAAGKPAHPLGVFGFANQSALNQWPGIEPSFASNILNRQVFESSRQGDQGRLVPFNPEKFILISAGRDGLYGTEDDIRNYQSN